MIAPLFIDGLLRDWFFGDRAYSDTSAYSDDLYMFIFWVCAFVFIGLNAFYVLCLVKFRRKPGVPQQRSSSHSTTLEITWTVLPTILLVVFFFRGFWGYLDKVVVEAQAEQLDLEAYKWGWEMTYPNGAVSLVSDRIDPGQLNEYPIFVVPEDWPVQLRMTSRDVIHSFWIPDLRQKFDVFPNRYTSYQFRMDPLEEEDRARANDAFPSGYRDHTLFCAEYCGDSHSEMAAIIRVASREDYANWVVTGGVELDKLTPVEAGAILYTVKGCAQCHSVDGSDNTGPTWRNAFGYERQFSNAPAGIVDDNYIRESILVPGAKVAEGYPNQMPSYQGKVNDFELNALIAYIRSLSDRAPTSLIDEVQGEPESTEEEPQASLNRPDTDDNT
ncbi:MAG: cytochrome c oxidase subunit II [Planctomycetota bacterium]